MTFYVLLLGLAWHDFRLGFCMYTKKYYVSFLRAIVIRYRSKRFIISDKQSTKKSDKVGDNGIRCSNHVGNLFLA